MSRVETQEEAKLLLLAALALPAEQRSNLPKLECQCRTEEEQQAVESLRALYEQMVNSES